MYRLWLCLLVTKTVAIAAAAGSPRVLATSWGPTVQDRRRSVAKRLDQVKKSAKLEGCGFESRCFTLKISIKAYSTSLYLDCMVNYVADD